ncbi:MAG: radical SAM protein [Promethearchaeota archaeon]
MKGQKCAICGRTNRFIPRGLGVCPDCVKKDLDKVRILSEKVHKEIRGAYGLPGYPPRDKEGIKCTGCAHQCQIAEGKQGYCGLRENRERRLVIHAGRKKGLLHTYLDPHVTNCCGCFFCPAGTGAGYPRFNYKPKAEHGYYNLASFLYGCNMNCLGCQNASHKQLQQGKFVTIDTYEKVVQNNERISCICWFGGDGGGPQASFTVKASQKCFENIKDRILRLCWETNGLWRKDIMKKAGELALESGGNIKFDLKAPPSSTSPLSEVLSGVPNEMSYDNFSLIAEEFYPARKDLPTLMGCTLLVPGFITAKEVDQIAEFIAQFDSKIPYSLLVFHPCWNLADLPRTPRKQVFAAKEVAEKHLETVHVGNLHLLSFL